jgi:hypothetical protein
VARGVVSSHAASVTESPNRRFQFHRRSQLFIGTNEERLPVSRCEATIQIVCSLESIAEMQPQLQPALLEIVSDDFRVFHVMSSVAC